MVILSTPKNDEIRNFRNFLGCHFVLTVSRNESCFMNKSNHVFLTIRGTLPMLKIRTLQQTDEQVLEKEHQS